MSPKRLAVKKAMLARPTDKTVCWMEKQFDPKNGLFIVEVHVFFPSSILTPIFLKTTQKLCVSLVLLNLSAYFLFGDLAWRRVSKENRAYVQ